MKENIIVSALLMPAAFSAARCTGNAGTSAAIVASGGARGRVLPGRGGAPPPAGSPPRLQTEERGPQSVKMECPGPDASASGNPFFLLQENQPTLRILTVTFVISFANR